MTLYLLMLNLLCIPFLLLLTHPQALSLRLQPELLGRNRLLERRIPWMVHYQETIWMVRWEV